MTEIETTAAFPQDKNARYFEFLLSQNGFSNRLRSGLSVAVMYDGHGSRLEVHDLIKQCCGKVADETIYDDD
jgi:hypothetical protein